MRKKQRKAKRLNKRYKSRNFKEELTMCNNSIVERRYKKELDFSIKKYRINLMKKIRNFRSSNPKEYWKIINQSIMVVIVLVFKRL